MGVKYDNPLFVVTPELFSFIFLRGYTGVFFELATEIERIVIADCLGNFGDIITGAFQ